MQLNLIFRSTMIQVKNHTTLVISLITLGILSRFIPHPPNATAVGAVAIFGGFAIQRFGLSAFILFLSLFLSDLAINNLVYGSFYESFVWFTPGFMFMYAGFFISILAGRFVKSDFSLSRLGGAGIISVIGFFLITNFGAWLGNPMYPQTLSGLIASYIAGLPFALNQFIFTVLYGTILFGAYGYISQKFPRFA